MTDERKVNMETREIPFTQFLRPRGTPSQVTTKSDLYTDDVLKKAQEILDNGFTFESEELTTGDVSATIGDPEMEEDVAIFVSRNDTEIPNRIMKMIMDFDIDKALAHRRGEDAADENGDDDTEGTKDE